MISLYFGKIQFQSWCWSTPESSSLSVTLLRKRMNWNWKTSGWLTVAGNDPYPLGQWSAVTLKMQDWHVLKRHNNHDGLKNDTLTQAPHVAVSDRKVYTQRDTHSGLKGKLQVFSTSPNPHNYLFLCLCLWLSSKRPLGAWLGSVLMEPKPAVPTQIPRKPPSYLIQLPEIAAMAIPVCWYWHLNKSRCFYILLPHMSPTMIWHPPQRANVHMMRMPQQLFNNIQLFAKSNKAFDLKFRSNVCIK